jgi:DNA polymerase III delta prime subunit
MDDNPFPNWSRDNARLLKTSLTQDRYPPVPVVSACERAIEVVDSGFVTKPVFAIPLFEPDSPKPTDEYLKYNPKSQNVIFYDADKGRMNQVSPQHIATTQLGQRLRWWLPDANQDIETLDENQVPPETVTPVHSLSDKETSEFFDEMRELVKQERQAEKQGNRERYDTLGLETAIHRGTMAGPLIPMGTATYEDDRAYKFQLTTEEDDDDDIEPNLRDDAGVFEDNEYIAGVRGYENCDPIEMEAVHVGDTELWLRPLNETITPNSPRDHALTDDAVTVWLHDLLNPLPYNRRLDAIDKVEQNRGKRQLLSGNRNVTFAANQYAVPDPEIELNDSQEKALIWAKAANNCLCIHGPPGTGKTRTLTAYIRDAVARDQRVLVTAHSNQAVDNLLVGDSTIDEPEAETLHAMAQDDDTDLTIARSGTNSKNPVVQRYYQAVTPAEADIVAATTSGAAQFPTDSFDIGIVDEATQASRAATAIAFSVSEKLILAGDHKQLPPFAASDDKLGDEQRLSLFETLINRYSEDIAVMLRTQYRMNEAIAAFPNDAFYDGVLKTADLNRNWTVDDLSPLMGIHINGTEQKQTASHSYYNPEEAEAAAKQVKLLTNSGLCPSDISVIAAYRGQVEEIEQQLHRLEIEDVQQVAVNTVDAFQGSEREAIIVSLVRSNPNASSGFLTMPDEGPRRLNVALTRGRKRVVVIGNWDTLAERAAHRDSDESCAELYADLEAHIRGIGKMLDAEPKPAQ